MSDLIFVGWIIYLFVSLDVPSILGMDYFDICLCAFVGMFFVLPFTEMFMITLAALLGICLYKLWEYKQKRHEAEIKAKAKADENIIELDTAVKVKFILANSILNPSHQGEEVQKTQKECSNPEQQDQQESEESAKPVENTEQTETSAGEAVATSEESNE
jgi:hypothetical protein